MYSTYNIHKIMYCKITYEEEYVKKRIKEAQYEEKEIKLICEYNTYDILLCIPLPVVLIKTIQEYTNDIIELKFHKLNFTPGIMYMYKSYSLINCIQINLYLRYEIEQKCIKQRTLHIGEQFIDNPNILELFKYDAPHVIGRIHCIKKDPVMLYVIMCLQDTIKSLMEETLLKKIE